MAQRAHQQRVSTDPDQVPLPFANGTSEHRRQEVQQAIDNACDQMRTEGVHPRDYVEQLSWLFFLKAFEESENRREEEASFDEVPYERRLDSQCRWSAWTKTIDRPDEMLRFVDGELWPKLQNFGDDPLAQRFRRIFSSIKNHQSRGPSFARVVAQVDKLHFNERTDVIVLSEIYERLLKDVAQVSGYAGEFYTPRHIIRAMVQVVAPRFGDRIYDPCFGSAGFLSEAAEEIRRHKRSWKTEELERFHKATFFGREMVPLAYLMGTMGLILHDVHDPVLELANTLEVHTNNVPENAKYSVILANPPYGGKMAQQMQTNFTVRSWSTEVLFLQHVMKNLARGGRASVIVPEGVLFRGGADQKVRERLLQDFNVHTVLSLPAGCFLPYTGVKANILFFNREEDERGTDSVWYYELTNDGFELKQTRRPVEGDQFPDFLVKWQNRIEGESSWIVSIKEIEKKGWDLSAQNPNRRDDYEHRPALQLVQSIKAKEERIFELLEELENILEDGM
jgi:type I restriction enzyme M protein